MKVNSDICGQLGVPLASNKTEGHAPKLTFLEIQIDSQS